MSDPPGETPPCAASLSRPKNVARTRALLKAHGLSNDGDAAAARRRSERPDLFAAPTLGAPDVRRSASRGCLLVGAGNYRAPAPYATFLRSLREAGCACDVALFTDNATDPEIRRIFRDFGARWIEFFPRVDGVDEAEMRAKTFGTLPGNGALASTFRFRLFYYYFLTYGQGYDKLGWLDVRDVFAQDDVFAYVPPEPGLDVFTETAVFSLHHKRKVYLDWSTNAWGYACDANYDDYSDLPPLNLGVVLGDRAALLDVLERLICDLGRCGGWDQFVFSKLLYETPRDDLRVHETDDGPVANLCSNLDVQLGDAGDVLNTRGAPYAIVHQWDRYDALANIVKRRFPYDAAAK